MHGISWLGSAFVALVACGHPSPPSRPVANTTTTRVTAARPTLAERATLVVIGRVSSYADVPVASIDVSRELKGAAGYGVTLDTKAGITDGDEGIFYLVKSPSSPDRWTPLAPKPEPSSREEAVIGELSGVDASPPPASLAADFATFRAAPAWGNGNNVGIEPAVKILTNWSMIGSSPAQIKAALGEPHTVEGDRWHYMRHNGESGAIFWLRFEHERVVVVDIGRTQ